MCVCEKGFSYRHVQGHGIHVSVFVFFLMHNSYMPSLCVCVSALYLCVPLKDKMCCRFWRKMNGHADRSRSPVCIRKTQQLGKKTQTAGQVS